jgi:AcrR family transcriptional regulator
LVARTPVHRRGKVRAENILTAFGQLLDENGFEGVKISELAYKSGSAVGSLYQFYAGKEAMADALRIKLADWLVAEVEDRLAERVRDNQDDGRDTTLVDCFVVLHQAMEAMHRTQPGARRLPVQALYTSAALLEPFRPFGGSLDDMALLDHITVAVATSAGCVKAAIAGPTPERGNQVIALGQWLLQELAGE